MERNPRKNIARSRRNPVIFSLLYLAGEAEGVERVVILQILCGVYSGAHEKRKVNKKVSVGVGTGGA